MDKIIGAFWYLKDRWSEPGSKAAITGLLAAAHMQVDPGLIQNAIDTLTLIFGACAFFTKEAKPLGRVE